MKNLTVACLQMCSGSQVEENLQRVNSALADAPEINLLVLPENFAQMPRNRHEQYCESPGRGLVQQTLADLAQAYQICIVAGSLAIKPRSAKRPYARCLVYDATGAQIAHYDKLHLFDVEIGDHKTQRYCESDTYQHGSMSAQQISPVALGIGDSTLQLGLTICYDLRFPELYRILASASAQLICVPSAFTYDTGRAHWQTLLRARAIENQVFIAAAAQGGRHENGRETWGHSMIIDPWGDVLAQQTEGSGLVFAQIDLTQIESLRQRFPVHKHRRIPHN